MPASVLSRPPPSRGPVWLVLEDDARLDQLIPDTIGFRPILLLARLNSRFHPRIDLLGGQPLTLPGATRGPGSGSVDVR